MLPLSIAEIIALALLIYGGVMGLKNGFLKELASMLGFFIGLYLAWRYNAELGGGVIAFLAIWILTPIGLGILASMVTKLLDWTVVGGLMNRLLGCIFGATKWGVLIVCVMIVTGQSKHLNKYINSEQIPEIKHIEEKWKTLQENL